MTCWGITARNEAQKIAIRALLNDKPYAFLTGPAGTGKSLVAQAVGLERTVERKDFDKIVYTRLQAQLGMEIGHLPGDINEKTYQRHEKRTNSRIHPFAVMSYTEGGNHSNETIYKNRG